MQNTKRLRNALAILALLLATGYLSYTYSQYTGIRARQSIAARRLAAFSTALFSPMDKYDYLPEITAKHPLLIDTLEHLDDPARLRELNLFLENLNRTAKTEAIYVIDAQGLTWASSNWQDRLTFIGQNYYFRPYFQDAMERGSGRFFGVGTVSQKPGYYLAHRVVSGEQGRGVVVVKVDLGDLDARWDENQDTMVVTDENGIAFLSSRKEWKYRALHALDAKTIEQLEKAQQYGTRLKNPVHIDHETSLDNGDSIVRIREPVDHPDAMERRYFVRSSTLPGSKWEVRIFTSLAETETRSKLTAAAVVASVTFLILLFMYFQQIRKRRSEKEESQYALELAHQELEAKHGELEILNTHLVDQRGELQLTVSELERAEAEAVSANQAKSEFLANMSHEIRTPMNAILGLTHLTLKTELSSKQRNYLANVASAANTLLGVLNNILDFSKIEADKLRIERIAFDLCDVFGNISSILALSAEGKGLELIFRIDPDVPPNLIGDPLRIGQVLLNLVSNAIKFTEEGEIQVSVDCTHRRGAQIELQFSVKDSGIGISANERECLFRSFSQADQSTTRRYGGTGLGLAISKKLVEAMNGSIEVASEVGQGSTFTFSVLLACDADATVSIRESGAGLSGMRVLVVDNNVTVRQVLSELLVAWSIDVVAVDSGAAAIEVVDEESSSERSAFDLILLDSAMPSMDGVETARRINLKLANTVAPLMIMLTSCGGDDSVQQTKEAGVDALLAKPIEPSMLLDSILNVINHQSAAEPDPRAIARPTEVPGPHVLVAEDTENNQNLVREILDSAGMTCDIVANGHDAVRCALEQPDRYAIILMDLEMPGMDGLDAAREIRRCASKQIPIIALTAHAMEQDRQRCLEVGINQHLTKPVNPARLIQEINRWATPDAMQESTQPVPSPIDAGASTTLLTDLDALLATNNIGAEKHALRLHKDLEGYGLDVLLNDLEQAIDQLDYPMARTILEKLIKAPVLSGHGLNGMIRESQAQ